MEANDAAEGFYGWSRDELVGISLSDLSAPRIETVGEQTIIPSDGKELVYDTEHVTKSGATRFVEVRLGPVTLSDRVLLYTVVIDRTLRKTAERLLKETEAKYRVILDTLAEAVLVVDMETHQIIEFNEACCALYGYTREELLGMNSLDLCAEPDLARTVLDDFMHHPELKKYVRHRTHIKKDGTRFSVEISSRQFSPDERRYLVAAVYEMEE